MVSPKSISNPPSLHFNQNARMAYAEVLGGIRSKGTLHEGQLKTALYGNGGADQRLFLRSLVRLKDRPEVGFVGRRPIEGQAQPTYSNAHSGHLLSL